jgi:hypothetical protein
MSLLTIAQDVARNTAIDIPSTAGGSTAREMVNIVQFINDTAFDVIRRVDWGALRQVTTIMGTGAPATHALPADFGRLIRGNAVSFNGAPVRGGLSPDEWASLDGASGTPRFFRLLGSSIGFYPHLASDATATIVYQSINWVAGGAPRMDADAQTALFPEDLLVKGAIWRQRRHIGQDFADHMAEFEAALADYAAHDARDRSP